MTRSVHDQSDYFRTSSAYFAELPWKTNVLLEPEGLAKLTQIPVLKKYVDTIEQHEKANHIDSGAEIVRIFCATGQITVSTTSKKYSLFVKELLNYRLLDVAGFLYGLGSPHTSIPRGDLPDSLRRISPRLSDWVGVVRRAQDTIQVHVRKWKPPIPVTSDSHSQTKRCFKYFCERLEVTSADKILLNFAVAAFHLSYLLEGHTQFPSEKRALEQWMESLDVPSKRQDVISKIEDIQVPLYLACAVSPVCLLVASSISERSMGKDAVFKMWRALGNEVPSALVDIERRVWGVLLSAVQDPESLPTLLHEATKAIDVNQFRLLEEWERRFLEPGTTSPSATYMDKDDRAGFPPVYPTPRNRHPLIRDHDESLMTAEQLAGAGLEELEESEADSGIEHPIDDDRMSGPSPQVTTQPGADAAVQEYTVNSVPGDEQVDDHPMSGYTGSMIQGDEENEELDSRDENQSSFSPASGTSDDLGDSVAGGVVGLREALDSLNDGNVVVEDVAPRRGSRIRTITPKEPVVLTKRKSSKPLSTPKEPFVLTKRKSSKPLSRAKAETKRPKLTQQKASRNYFEEINDNGIMRFVMIEDLTREIVEPDIPKLASVGRTTKVYSHTAFDLWAPHTVIQYHAGFHWEDELKLFTDLHGAVQKHYVNDRPLWQSHPRSSSFQILSQRQMELASTAEIQKILETKHIYISPAGEGCYPDPNVSSFTPEILSTLGRLDKSIIIHDASKPNTFDQSSRHMRGTLQNLLSSHDAADGKILNALDLPRPGANNFTTTFATDVQAFNFTLDMPTCSRDIPYPSADMKWGLAANTDAHHTWHIDSNGFGTVIEVITGYKWWVVGREKRTSDFASISLFLEGFGVDKVNNEKWDLEAMLLAPGSKLIMRPNTPHFVSTPYAAACHGGHFYAIGAIRSTIFGFYHGFCASGLVTNTHHNKASRLLLGRIITYIHYALITCGFDPRGHLSPNAHVPQVSTFEGALDLIMLCVFMEFGKILDPDAYGCDNLPDHQDVISTIRCRGFARDLIEWWDSHYTFRGHDGTQHFAQELFSDLFANHARALVIYKRIADSQKIATDNDCCTAIEVERWITFYHGSFFEGLGGIPQFWKEMTFDWTGDRYSVVCCPEPSSHSLRNELDILELGALVAEKSFVQLCRQQLGKGTEVNAGVSSDSDDMDTDSSSD